jgi:hypothetical protein
MPNDTATLLEDIYTHGNTAKAKNGGLYGKKGEKVKIISIRGEVAIVEGKQRFPVKIEKLKIA